MGGAVTKSGSEMIKPDIKQRFIKALRSGKYKPAQGRLRRTGSEYEGFCCLGVLCQLHLEETNTPWQGKDYQGSEASLPAEVINWALTPLGQTRSLQIQANLIHINDRKLLGFKGIADYIQDNY